MASVLLHGDIDATICEVQHPHGLKSAKLIVYLDDVKIEERHIENLSSNADLQESFHIRCAHETKHIIFRLQRHGWLGQVIGQAYVRVSDIINGAPFDNWIGIGATEAQEPRDGGPKIHVKLQFHDAKRHQNWGKGINGPEFPGVPGTSFLQQKGCKVTLYQDAHVHSDFEEKMESATRMEIHKPQSCWKDIYNAIKEAEKFVYIAGWSLETDITLIRDSPAITLGDLLKNKAQNHVRVILLLWEDKTNVSSGSGGHMKTFCKKTQKYFENTGVRCFLCPRPLLSGYSHHQKIVLADSVLPGDNKRRGIVSFIGGFDLSYGRYDTPTHSLFRTLNAEHSQDFHQPCFRGSSIKKGGPREPWHDVHCKLEGPIAKDVYGTFVERCRKEGIADLLVPTGEVGDSYQVTDLEDPETWNVQLFRSIDDLTICGLPNTAEGVARAGLVRREGKIIDRSIQDAYIHAIRRAERFIYIENQYFMGSSFDWTRDDDDNKIDDDCANLIPNELSLKIVSKIKADERFVVYVVIPMWPEGRPNGRSGSVQNMLYFQRRTMETMYKRIVQALKEKEMEKGTEADNNTIQEAARKYLSFFCLGNREEKKDGEYKPPQRPKRGSHCRKAQEARRFMIYVHSKMMIVDDEYIVVGSANINERSMAGDRDTEIAMGAYQPQHLAIGNGGARGQIHGFRMSLWYEHLGTFENAFLNPETEQCINTVNDLAQQAWDSYSADWSAESAEPNDLPRHLLRYPFDISDDGTLTNLSEFEYFPDTTAPILGQHDATLAACFIPDTVEKA